MFVQGNLRSQTQHKLTQAVPQQVSPALEKLSGLIKVFFSTQHKLFSKPMSCSATHQFLTLSFLTHMSTTFLFHCTSPYFYFAHKMQRLCSLSHSDEVWWWWWVPLIPHIKTCTQRNKTTNTTTCQYNHKPTTYLI